jgi:hypothetical protein
MRKLWTVITLLASVLLLVALASSQASARSLDPSPYCRPYASAPYATGEARAGGGHYTLSIEGVGGLSCNGPATIALTAVLHYTTNPCQGGCGAKTGPTVHCSASCEASVPYTRTLFCGYHYAFSDYVQLTGTWNHNGVMGNVSFNGYKSSGSSYNPPGVC